MEIQHSIYDPYCFLTIRKEDAIPILQRRLKEAGVAVVLHVIPQTDHAFDLILPKISPSAHNAIYDADRFLAIWAKGSFPQRSGYSLVVPRMKGVEKTPRL